MHQWRNCRIDFLRGGFEMSEEKPPMPPGMPAMPPMPPMPPTDAPLDAPPAPPGGRAPLARGSG